MFLKNVSKMLEKHSFQKVHRAYKMKREIEENLPEINTGVLS